EETCRECGGKRLRKESIQVLIAGKNIMDMTGLSVADAAPHFEKLKLPGFEAKITEPILKEIRSRVRFLHDVGLGYLTLDRSVATLSGGELQRIRLAAQIGVGLTGV